jgi:frataxin-like iron-binding protein CyaY
MSNLSEKLRTTIKVMEEAKIKGVLAQAAADRAKLEAQRNELELYLEIIKKNLVLQIEAGQVPKYIVNDYGRQREWKSAKEGTAKFYSVWTDFFGWFENEGLELTISYDHDGVGIDSWLVISAKPLDNTL